MEVLQLDQIRIYRAKVRTREGQTAYVPVAVIVDAKTGKKSVSQPDLPSTPVHARFARAVVDAVNAMEGKPPSEKFEDMDLDGLLDNDVVIDPEEEPETPAPAPVRQPRAAPKLPKTVKVPSVL